jgi:hypothetical protein
MLFVRQTLDNRGGHLTGPEKVTRKQTLDNRGGHQTEREKVTRKQTLDNRGGHQTLNKKLVENLIVVSADSFTTKQKSIIVELVKQFLLIWLTEKIKRTFFAFKTVSFERRIINKTDLDGQPKNEIDE